MAKVCHLSKAGLLSEALGYGFMRVGDMAHVTALELEGKPIPARLQYVKKRMVRKPLRESSYYGQNLGFIMPGSGFNVGDFSFLSNTIAKVPFQAIGELVGWGFTAYGYYKIVIVAYRYSQKLISKYTDNRLKIQLRNGLVKKQARFLVISVYRIPSLRKTLLIHKATTSNFQIC